MKIKNKNKKSSQDEPKLKRIQSMAMENGFSRGESELKRFDSTPDLRSQAQVVFPSFFFFEIY